MTLQSDQIVGNVRVMTIEQTVALRDAVDAFKEDREMRTQAAEARRSLKFHCGRAHALGVSDQQLANAFGEYSRARIQQIRAKDEVDEG